MATPNIWNWYDTDNKTLHLATSQIDSNYTQFTGGMLGKAGIRNIVYEGVSESNKLVLPANCRGLFTNCWYVTEIKTEYFDTSNATNMEAMFMSCSQLTKLDLRNFDTSNVTTMKKMFNYCRGLTMLDLSSFNTANLTTAPEMFNTCIALKTIYVSNSFVTTNIEESSMMFNCCFAIVGGNGTTYDSKNVEKTYARIDTSDNAGYFTDIADAKIVSATTNPNNAGTITGVGYYASGDSVTLQANANVGYTFKDWLLKGYTQLEYIESSGTQYIDTGFVSNSSTKIDITFQYTSTQDTSGIYDTSLYGTGISGNVSAFFVLYTSSNSFYSITGNKSVILGTTDTNEHHLIYNDNTNVYIDGINKGSISGSDYSNTRNLFIFKCNQSNLVTGAKAKLYSCKIYSNQYVLVRDYIPVIRHSDGAIGLLDLVNLKFYGNSGSGEFIGGNPV